MDATKLEILVVGGFASLLFLLLVWFGFKFIFLPLRLIWRFGRGVGERIGPAPLSLLLVWTIALEPQPFIYLWGWFLRFGKALLVDAPRQMMPTISQVQNACSWSESNCFSSMVQAFYQVWGAAIVSPISSFEVPGNIARAVVIFAIGASLAIALARPSAGTAPQPGTNNVRTAVALGVSFLFSLYLVILSIIAIPAFGEKVADVTPHRTNLAEQLRQAVAAVKLEYPELDNVMNDRENIPNVNTLTFPGHAQILDAAKSLWEIQLQVWDQSAARLREAVLETKTDADSFSGKTLAFFQVSNEGHIGEMPTQRHASVLGSAFTLWISDRRTGLDSCTANLREGLIKLRTFHGAMVTVSESVPTGNAAIPFEQIGKIFGALHIQRCGDLRLVAALPLRTGPADTLGPFGITAAWLLQTENFELALIVGLLGFGFFGSLAASFIREFAGTPGNELPAIGFVLPALVRGVGAAILVFLLAKGGTAILTRGDASPNAYAIFVACFVAAVFSEDVWSWARARQLSQFRERAQADADKPAAPNGGGPPKPTQRPDNTTAPTTGPVAITTAVTSTAPNAGLS